MLQKAKLPDQYTYLDNRNIRNAISDMKIRIDEPLQKQCVLSIDFTKVFDAVDRKYLFQMLRKMSLPLLLVDMLENLYGITKAMIGVNVFLSKEISLGRGIRQGCPLSALLFIVPTFDTKVTEYLCSGWVFFSSDKFRLFN